jgi:O-acetyl-ADP-ribose deacetylase
MISRFSFLRVSINNRRCTTTLNWRCLTAKSTPKAAAIDDQNKNTPVKLLRMTSLFNIKPKKKRNNNRIKVGYTDLATYNRSSNNLPNVIIVHGSVLEFTTEDQNDTNVVGCIVNAANETCLGGGGIDGAIADAGGPALAEDRLNLPYVIDSCLDIASNDNNDTNSSKSSKRRSHENNNSLPRQKIKSIRCRTGSAVITGPGNYGKLHVPYVIHAIGPNFHSYIDSNQEEIDESYKLLRSAYHTSLDIASSTSNPITNVAFCLISAGVYRGIQPLERILQRGLMAINEWRPSTETSDSHSPINAHTAIEQSKLIDSDSTSHLTTTDTTTTTNSTNHNTKLTDIYVFAYTERECELLQRFGKQIFASDENNNK